MNFKLREGSFPAVVVSGRRGGSGTVQHSAAQCQLRGENISIELVTAPRLCFVLMPHNSECYPVLVTNTPLAAYRQIILHDCRIVSKLYYFIFSFSIWIHPA